jgi:hypothetical protein
MEKVGGKNCRVTIAGVQAVPGGWPTIGSKKAGDECAFAEPGLGGDQCDGCPECFIKARREARTV